MHGLRRMLPGFVAARAVPIEAWAAWGDDWGSIVWGVEAACGPAGAEPEEKVERPSRRGDFADSAELVKVGDTGLEPVTSRV